MRHSRLPAVRIREVGQRGPFGPLSKRRSVVGCSPPSGEDTATAASIHGKQVVRARSVAACTPEAMGKCVHRVPWGGSTKFILTVSTLKSPCRRAMLLHRANEQIPTRLGCRPRILVAGLGAKRHAATCHLGHGHRRRRGPSQFPGALCLPRQQAACDSPAQRSEASAGRPIDPKDVGPRAALALSIDHKTSP